MFKKSTKTIHIIKLAYPIGTIKKPPFQNQILTERVLHVAHSNTYRVIGGKFHIPSQTTERTTDSFDVSSSIDQLLHENNQDKKDDQLKKLKGIDWESSDAFGRIVKKTDASEKRNYLRKLFASTNNQLSSVIITKLTIPSSLDPEKYFESPNQTDSAYDISTELITELRHVDIEELEFNPDDLTFELRFVAATARVLEERKKTTKSKQRQHFLIAIMLIVTFAATVQLASQRLGEKTTTSIKEREERGASPVSGEEVSANIIRFAKSQGVNREKSYLEEKMDTVTIKAVEKMKQPFKNN